MDLGSTLSNGLSAATGSVSGFLTAMAALGTISMALLQAAKDAFPLRRWFQRSWLRDWMARASVPPRGTEPPKLTWGAQAAETQLVELSTAGDARAFFELPVEQLCGQMLSAAHVAVDYPDKYRDLLLCLAHSARGTDVSAVLNPPPEAQKKLDDLSPDERKRMTDYVDARNRVNHMVQRAIDSVQIAMGFRWKWLLQMAAMLISGFLGALAYRMGSEPFEPATTMGYFLLSGVLGGFLAPVARDLVAAIESVRGRK